MNNSRAITSNQPGLHPRLQQVVRRHLDSHFQRPYADHSLRAFEQVSQVVARHSGPLILDSYCGVGESTIALAQQYPSALVIGVDKSRHRLEKHGDHGRSLDADNYHLVRADIDDFWRLALDSGWRLSRHCIFYPNPWPKSAQLKRRCHGSPLFPTLLQLGGELELRSNWAIYVEEFACALTLSGFPANSEPYRPNTAITPFERKYLNSGQPLWRCLRRLD